MPSRLFTQEGGGKLMSYGRFPYVGRTGQEIGVSRSRDLPLQQTENAFVSDQPGEGPAHHRSRTNCTTCSATSPRDPEASTSVTRSGSAVASSP